MKAYHRIFALLTACMVLLCGCSDYLSLSKASTISNPQTEYDTALKEYLASLETPLSTIEIKHGEDTPIVWEDTGMEAAVRLLLNRPEGTIILILISYVASPSIQTLILGMSITGWIAMARFIRNQILIIRDRDYNVASRCIGTPIRRIVLRNLLPYLVSVIMLRMALTIPAAIGSEVFITYIGLGLSVETPSLGNLINDGRKVMMQAGLRYQLLYPTIILSFVTIAFYLIGNAFSDAADPKNHLQ